MTQAEQIYHNHKLDPLLIFDTNYEVGRKILLAAINEALNLNADKMKHLENSCVVWSQKYGLLELEVAHLKKRSTELEEENKRLREGRYGEIKLAYDIGQTDLYKQIKGWKRDYISGHDYYTKNFNNEQQTD